MTKPKDPNYKYCPETVYGILVRDFPHIFQKLRQVPPPLPNPGNQPSPPRRTSYARLTIKPSDDFNSITQKFLELFQQPLDPSVSSYVVDLSEGRIQIHREVIPPEIPEPDEIEIDPDSDQDRDWDWDTDDWTDHHYRNDGPPATYGEPNFISIQVTAENPRYSKEHAEYLFKQAQWEQQTKSRRERAEKIKVIQDENKTKIYNAQTHHRDLWILAGREHRFGSDNDLLKIRRDALQQQLDQLNERLSLVDSE